MRRKTRYLLTALLFVSTLIPNLMAQLPPLIDREIFFGDPEITGAQLSPDGRYMSFLKPYKGTRNIWVKKVDQDFEEASPVTADTTRPISGYFWSRDGEYLLYVQDKGGNENYHIYAVDPQGEPVGDLNVPEARNLTPMDEVRALIYAVPKSDPDLMYIGLNDRDRSWHDLYTLRISTGELKLLRENTERITGWVFDLDDNLRMATRSAENGDTEVLRVDDDGFELVYTCDVLETCYPLRFHKNGEQIYMVTNKGDNVDLTRMILFNPQTKEVELVESDPENRVDFGSAYFSEVDDELVATFYNDEKRRRYWKDPAFEKDYEILKRQVAGKEVGLGSSTDDEQLWLVNAYSDTDPGATYLFNRETKELTFQYRGRPEMPIDDLAPMKPVKYKSLDGLLIPAYLTLPKGVKPQNLPTIIMPHGGPWYRDSWGYDPYAQFLANRGYAVLQPNFRSSTGYGKAFLNAGNGEWGQAMQDDLTAGAQYLIESGIADPERVGIFGGSYGGYATLAGLTFTPDLYAAGVSLVGPSSLLTLLNSLPPYWEAGRKIFHTRMADPNTPEGEALLKKQSPLFYADQIKVPLLVVQGANDPRVKKAESDQIVVAMRELGLPVEYIVAPDEGHGFRKPVNNMAFLAAMEKFFAKHLDGRYQESMTDEVGQRLEEITVDIEKVEMPKKVDASAMSAGLPEVESDLSAAENNYSAKIEVSNNEMQMQTSTTIEDQGEYWLISEVAQTPMGAVSDQVKVKKGSLEMVSREVAQGPVKIAMQYSDEAVTGTMNMNGNETEIKAEIDGPMFADGGGSNEILAQLPLIEGYTLLFRNFDVQAQKSKLYELKVVGREEVKVPSGTFNALKVEIKPAEGDPGSRTLWVTDDNKVVKAESVVPQMGGAVITSELK